MNAEISRVLNVLMVEDDQTNIMVAEAYMNMQGYPLTVAKNGAAGVEAFENGTFDIILMDIQMPIMDGLEATRKIRELPGGADIPIIAVTAGKVGVNRDKALEAGMDEFMPKPVEWRDLFALMDDLVAS